jgi:hypothetical protein
MGAFYTNVTVGHAAVDAVVAVLEELGRTVALDAHLTPVS